MDNNTVNNGLGVSEESQKEMALKNVRMDGPTFKALRKYFAEWEDQDPTLVRRQEQ